jgi:adenylate cyclase
MAEEGFKRKLTTILSADVVGYSRLMEDNEEATIQTLNTYRNSMSTLIEQHSGRVVDMTGDNIMAEFSSVVDAVKCAVKTQKEISERNTDLPENRRMLFRIGVNLGDIVEEGNRIYGDGVNIAARLEGLAEGGGICISGTAYDQLKNKLELGYEFLGEHKVKNIAAPVRVYKVLMEPEAAGKIIGAKRKKNRWIAVAAAVVILIGLAGWYLFIEQTKRVEPASVEKMAFPLPEKPSIAVLPFDNMSGDPDQEYFCDGITDQIITSLSLIPRLFVIARNSTFTYKGKATKVKKVAEELGVRYVLEGSVQKSEDRLRILVQLIDAVKGIHLWSERYDRNLKDLFALQDEIAMKIMTALQVKLTEGDFAGAIAAGTSNLEALECFWRSEEHFFRLTKEDNAVARTWAKKAIQLDPDFAGAWALLGYTYFIDVAEFGGKNPAQSMKLAEESAQKSLSINDSTAKALALMGSIREVQHNYDEAVNYGEKAVAVNFNDPTIAVILAIRYHHLGRFDESIALIKKAMRISPYYPAFYLKFLAPSYILAGRYDEAIETSKLMLERSRKGEINPLDAHIVLAEAYAELGQMDNAKAQAEEVLKINPKYSLEGDVFLNSYKNPAYIERRRTALRKAGLPE